MRVSRNAVMVAVVLGLGGLGGDESGSNSLAHFLGSLVDQNSSELGSAISCTVIDRSLVSAEEVSSDKD